MYNNLYNLHKNSQNLIFNHESIDQINLIHFELSAAL
jgi:hypothetical protein